MRIHDKHRDEAALTRPAGAASAASVRVVST
jgi:hypothetical protein